MKIYCEGLKKEEKFFEDVHSKNKDILFLAPVDIEIRFKDGKLSLNLFIGDILEIVYRKQTNHEVVRIYGGTDKTNYILELDKVEVINIEERK